MNCPDTGLWQAYLDNEVTEIEKQQLQEHAFNCAKCKDQIEKLKDIDQLTNVHLGLYQQAITSVIEEHPIDNSHLTIFKPKKKLLEGKWMTSKLKKLTAVAASVLVLTGVLSFAPVQDAVADFLSIFRVQKIQMVKITPDEMEKMARAIDTKVGEIDLKQFGKVEVTKKPEQVKLSLQDAAAGLPFAIKQPSHIPAGFNLSDKVDLQKEGQAEFKLNVEQANSLLKGLGSGTLLPTSLDGKAFSIHVPAGVSMDYKNSQGHHGFTFSQFASPEVTVPDGVDARDLRAALLDLPILPDDLRQQLASIDDWQNTMIIPDTGEGKVEKLSIGGNEAIYAQNMSGMSHLMWVDNGVICQLNGKLNREDTLNIAQSLY